MVFGMKEYWYIKNKRTGLGYRLDGIVQHYPYAIQAHNYINKVLKDPNRLTWKLKRRRLK